VNVTVTNAAGTSALNTSDVYVFGAPTLASVAPRSGPIAGGNTVTITGSGFTRDAVVNFGTTPGTGLTFISTGKLTIVAPAHATGTVHVSVTTLGGTDHSNPNDIYAFGPPTVTGVSPNTGSVAGGNTVTVTGTNFVPGEVVMFGTAAGTGVTQLSSGKLTVVAPAHAAGTVNVTVTTAAGTSAQTSADDYTFM
jgi:hypothetical protein